MRKWLKRWAIRANRGRLPSDKMVWEAINWTGPFLRERADGQAKTYVGVLRRFAMEMSEHEDAR